MTANIAALHEYGDVKLVFEDGFEDVKECWVHKKSISMFTRKRLKSGLDAVGISIPMSRFNWIRVENSKDIIDDLVFILQSEQGE